MAKAVREQMLTEGMSNNDITEIAEISSGILMFFMMNDCYKVKRESVIKALELTISALKIVESFRSKGEI